jgi:leucyl-tRNA synthetase
MSENSNLVVAPVVEEKAKPTARRDALLAIQERVQKQWEDEKVHVIDSVPGKEGNSSEKFFATFPYPYMNGVLHLGHAFTLAKSEFAARYQKLLGKQVLYPFAFHCTGMPIAACAEKLAREIQLYGNPPVFPVDEPEPEPTEEEEKEDDKADDKAEDKKDEKEKPKAGRKKKGKLLKKASKKKYQWEIMEEIGVPVNEIALFADSLHWLKYFPPIAQDHLKAFGLYTDFRRSFITTDVNPYYDAFVRWHFNTLKELGKIDFGNRNTIFSPKDNQACADHDRAEGEGAGVSEFTLIKLRLLELPDELKTLLTEIKEPRVFLPAATLRPETMYGQTNLFVLPTGDYGVYVMKNGDIFVCSNRSMMNMAYQNLTAVRGQPHKLGEVKGEIFMGRPVSAPYSCYERVYVLPLLTIKMGKGTGIVTSVPSDAPDDYAALMDMKNKAAFRQKFNIADECVLPFEVVPIIHTPGVGNAPLTEGAGNTPAKDLCIEMKITTQNDSVKLALAKDRCYLQSFETGIMAVGKYRGQPVRAAKPLIKADMIAAGLADLYAEPDCYVESRTGNECVVALADQWYLKYGEEKWKQQIAEHNENTLQTYTPATKKRFRETIDWLKEWACSRTFGLGTRLPWDEKWVVESLSDSTIYMAYYTIAHLLQGGVLDGSVVGPAGVRAEQLTSQVFNYIFRNKDCPTPPVTDIPLETLDTMKREFEFWYPMDLRVSGKDLINNHLTMSLYNHAAIWSNQPEMWPRSFFTNGHLMINAMKMSKSTGNFMTMSDAIAKFGADATRFALADSGDSLEDANFDESTANATILRLTKEDAWIDEIISDSTLRSGDYNFFDLVFQNKINICIRDCKTAMDQMLYHNAIVAGVFELTNARDSYRACVEGPLHRDLCMHWLKVYCLILSPFCPHFAQHAWSKIGQLGFIINSRFPEPSGEENLILTRQMKYLDATGNNVRASLNKKLATVKKANDKGKGPKTIGPVFNAATIFVAPAYSSWQQACLRMMQQEMADGKEAKTWARSLASAVSNLPEIKANKKLNAPAMQFVGFNAGEFETRGAAALELQLPFDELKLLTENIQYIKRGLDVEFVNIDTNDSPFAISTGNQGVGDPGKPVPYFYVKDT